MQHEDNFPARQSSQGGLIARVFITGSTDGLSLMAAQLLADGGRAVTLHARNDRRPDGVRRVLPAAEHIVVDELAPIEESREIADQVNALGRYDAVIHNAGIGYREIAARRESTDSRTCSERRAGCNGHRAVFLPPGVARRASCGDRRPTQSRFKTICSTFAPTSPGPCSRIRFAPINLQLTGG
jgi:hypothetical protein